MRMTGCVVGGSGCGPASQSDHLMKVNMGQASKRSRWSGFGGGRGALHEERLSWPMLTPDMPQSEIAATNVYDRAKFGAPLLSDLF